MALKEQFEKHGVWLFRWRSYIPLIIFPVLIAALSNSIYLEEYLGDFYEDIYETFCISIAFFGLALRAYTIGHVPKGTSGRNTKEQVAETLNTTGIYSVVRHPLYLANFIIFFGLVLYVPVWWFMLLYVLLFIIYYERIMYAEEAYLRDKFGDTFIKWAEATPAFIPRLKNWKPSTLPFSFRHVLKREYSGFFTIVASFTFVEIMDDLIAEGRINLDTGWIVFFFGGLVIYLTLMYLKKNTTVLRVEGR